MAGVNIQTAGTILIVVGVIGLVASLFMELAYANRRGGREVEVEREPAVRERF